MVRYIMSFEVPPGRQQQVQSVIEDYFDELIKNGPGGMRSQCYASAADDCVYVHIKGFRKESVAHQHFRSAVFREYIGRLAGICGKTPVFAKLQQQQTFESIY